LILVPTELERARLADQGGFPLGVGLVATAGFGPIAAAARTSQLLHELTPARVVLIGIAGSFDAQALAVGTATEFDVVAVEGLGVGEGASLIAPPALGFPQWPGVDERGAIHDRIELAPLARCSGSAPRLLLTTCAASGSPAQAALRRERFPAALAEDMEGFGVALALRAGRHAAHDRAWHLERRRRARSGALAHPSALCAARELVLAGLAR
jgi:futalosine hydrolase